MYLKSIMIPKEKCYVASPDDTVKSVLTSLNIMVLTGCLLLKQENILAQRHVIASLDISSL